MMRRGFLRSALLSVLAAAAIAALVPTAFAQAVPYPLEDCKALAADLEKRVPIPGPFEVDIQWFREGDLGIKGRQCRIAAEGGARREIGAKADPGIEDMVMAVTETLGKHGFRKNKMVDRYTRKGEAYRAFAMRKDRVTCWTNVEFQMREADAPANPGLEKSATEGSGRVWWTLNVECFKG